MSDDNEVKGTRGFIVTTEPTKEAKDLVAQYLRDKNNELRQFQAGTSQAVPGYDSGRTQRNTLDRADWRSDLADPFNNLGSAGNMPSGLTEGVGNILERRRYEYRGPINKNVGTDDEFLTSMYEQYLGRDADPKGFQYWKGRLAAGDSRDLVESDLLSSQEAQEKQQARIGGAKSFISDEFLDLFSKTGSGVKYGDYLQDKDDMDSVAGSEDNSSLGLKNLSDAYKSYLDDDDEGNTDDFLKNYLADLG